MAGRHARPTRAQARVGDGAATRQALSPGAKARKRARLRRHAKGAAAGSSLIAGALLIGLLAGGGTYALWNDEAVVNAGTIHGISDGEVSLRFAVGSPTASAAAFDNLLPGESKTIPVLLENDGEADLAIHAQLTATTGSGYSLRLAIDAACTTSGFLTSPYLTSTALALATPQTVGSIADGVTSKLCVQVTAGPSITPSSAATFDVTLIGDSGS
jgi:predicted ribosomally synthesized peptide with SipW-like signal peptide